MATSLEPSPSEVSPVRVVVDSVVRRWSNKSYPNGFSAFVPTGSSGSSVNMIVNGFSEVSAWTRTVASIHGQARQDSSR